MQTAVAAPPLTSTRPPHFTRPTFLMCPPQWYDVDYVINPWMAGNLHRPTRDRAFAQWRSLFDQLHALADVRVMAAEPGSPDMVFVAHAAAIQHGVAALASFAHPQRQAEEQHLRRWLEAEGFLIWETPRETTFEGEGDAVFDPRHNVLWAAHGLRTCRSAHHHLASAWLTRVSSLHLIDPRFFHLDTCFTLLHGGHVLYFPDAFDKSSLALIHETYAPERRIAVTESEATRFGCNVLNVGGEILMARTTDRLAGQLTAAGYAVTQLDLSEFLCGGGAAKSMALRLSDAVSAPSPHLP